MIISNSGVSLNQGNNSGVWMVRFLLLPIFFLLVLGGVHAVNYYDTYTATPNDQVADSANRGYVVQINMTSGTAPFYFDSVNVTVSGTPATNCMIWYYDNTTLLGVGTISSGLCNVSALNITAYNGTKYNVVAGKNGTAITNKYGACGLTFPIRKTYTTLISQANNVSGNFGFVGGCDYNINGIIIRDTSAPVPALTIAVNNTRTNALLAGFSYNYTTTNTSDALAKSGYCNTQAGCFLTNYTGTLNVTVFNVSGGTFFNPYDSPKFGLSFTGTSTYTFQTYQNSLQANLTNMVNGSLLSGFCLNVSNSTASQANCTSGSLLTFYNVVGSTTLSYYNISSSTYFNVTHNIGSFNSTLSNFTNSTAQALLNVTAYRLFLNTSINSFNASNGGSSNTTGTSSLIIPANNGSNTIVVNVTGNYSKTQTCAITVPFSTGLCNVTDIYDDNFTIGVNNGSASLSGFTLVARNSTLGGILYNQSVGGNNVTLPLLQGYYYNFSIDKPAYLQNSSLLQANASVNNYNFTLKSTNIYITFLDELNRTIIASNISVGVIYADGTEVAYSTNTSSLALVGSLIPGDYTFRYTANGYSIRDYYLSLGVADANLTLYLISSSNYQPGIVEVRTSDGALIGGAVIQLQRYYGDPLLQNIVSEATTNSFGEAVMTAEVVTGSYFWTVFVNGVNQYDTSIPELLSLGSDGLWHKTVILNITAGNSTGPEIGFSPLFVSPVTSLVNGTLYTFTFNISSDYYSMSSCSYQLINDSNDVVLASSSGWCSAHNGSVSVSYTTDQQGYVIDAVAIISTGSFNNTYRSSYTVLFRGDTDFTLVDALDDITDFHGSGFDDFGRFLISVIVIVLVVAGLSRKTDLINSDVELLVLIFVLTAFFSYVGWMNLDLPYITNVYVRQWILCIIVGMIAFTQAVRRYGGQQ